MLAIKFAAFVHLILSLGGYHADAGKDSISDFEKRLTKIRRSITEHIADGSVQPTDDEDITEDGSGDDSGTDNDVKSIIHRFSMEQNDCCRIGELLANLGFHCRNVRFSEVDRRLKLNLINRTFRDLGVEITDHTRVTLFLPFRKCVLQQPRNIDKCCLVPRNQNNAKMNIGSKTFRNGHMAGFGTWRSGKGCTGRYGNCRYVDARTSRRTSDRRGARRHVSRLSRDKYN